MNISLIPTFKVEPTTTDFAPGHPGISQDQVWGEVFEIAPSEVSMPWSSWETSVLAASEDPCFSDPIQNDGSIPIITFLLTSPPCSVPSLLSMTQDLTDAPGLDPDTMTDPTEQREQTEQNMGDIQPLPSNASLMVQSVHTPETTNKSILLTRDVTLQASDPTNEPSIYNDQELCAITPMIVQEISPSIIQVEIDDLDTPSQKFIAKLAFSPAMIQALSYSESSEDQFSREQPQDQSSPQTVPLHTIKQTHNPVPSSETVSPSSQSGRDLWAQTIQQLQPYVKEGSHRFMIELTPASLGKISVQLDINADYHVSLQMQVSSAEALNVLREHTSTLQKIFEESHFVAERHNLTFSWDQQQNHKQPFSRESFEAHTLAPPLYEHEHDSPELPLSRMGSSYRYSVLI